MLPHLSDARPRLRAAVTLAVLVTGLVLLAAGGPAGAQTGGAGVTVATTTVEGPITPVIADHLGSTLARAADDGHAALLVRLDTPGGSLDATRQIVRDFLDAPLPVIVHVAPGGADAASAGTFITYAAHVAAMAPATTIGAATPVDLEGGEVGGKIVENTVAFAEAIAEERGRDVQFAVDAVREAKTITAAAALEEGVIDLVAATPAEVLAAADGTQVVVRDATVTLEIATATFVEMEMTGVQRLLQTLANPNLVFIFLSLGTLAILYEIANPGLGLGGVVGVVSIVLAMFALSVLPVNWAGAALLLVAAGMFVAELFAPGIGVGAAGGTVALVLGGLFLFQGDTGLGVDWWVLVPTALASAVLAALAGVLVNRTRHLRSTTGGDDLVGRVLRVENAAVGRPRAQVGSTWWRLRAHPDLDRPLRDGDEVTVVERQNLDLVVLPTSHDASVGDDPTPTQETPWNR